MELKTTYKPTEDLFENTKMRNLPILQHFDNNSIKTSTDAFRKGELPLYNIIRLLIFGAVGYFSWVYVLPKIFFAIGQLSAIVVTVVSVLALIMATPVIFKALRRFTRFLHKSVIKHDPFGELKEQRKGMLANQQRFRMSRGQIQRIRNDMAQAAAQSEENAKSLQDKVVLLKKKADKLKAKMDSIVKEQGGKAAFDDVYVDTDNKYQRTLAQASNIAHEYEQEKSFISKYGSRANVMKKLDHKLSGVENAIGIKLMKFDTTVKILKKDYEFARKSNQATSAAKSAMGVTTAWEVEYAIDVVAATIANDIAITSSNLKDIDSMTSKYAIDSDELYANLDRIANNIESGTDTVNSASDYNSSSYVLTQEDKKHDGGFADIF